MDNTKKILICIITVIFIAIIVILIILFNANSSANNEKEVLNDQEQEYINFINNPASVVNGKKPEYVQSENAYLTVQNILKKYLEYSIKNNKEAVFALEDEQYIEYKKSNETIITNTNQIKNTENLYIENMYVLNGSQYHEFYIKFFIDDNELYIEVNQDTKNKTFSIIPLDKNEFEKKINTVIEGRKGEENQIKKNNYNEYTPVSLKEDGIAEAYMVDLKEKMLNNLDHVYEIIDNEYKNKKFPTLEDFRNYIEENKQSIQNSIITQYDVQTEKGKRKYVCIDNYNNTYTFNIISAMKYTVLLDNYTIESEEFINRYNNLNEKEKVATNIDKFIKCINNKDYNQAYSYLDDGFKTNYFKTLNDFKQYTAKNFYDNNIVKDIKIENEGNIFICTITIKSGVGVGAYTTTKTINIKLKEETDFVMSFNIE